MFWFKLFLNQKPTTFEFKMNLICKHSIISVTFKSEFKFNPGLS
jgi:hypothetical protein